MFDFEPARTVSHTMRPTRMFTGFEGPLFPPGDRDLFLGAMPGADLDDEIQSTAARLYDEVGTVLEKPADAEPETVCLPAVDR